MVTTSASLNYSMVNSFFLSFTAYEEDGNAGRDVLVPISQTNGHMSETLVGEDQVCLVSQTFRTFLMICT